MDGKLWDYAAACQITWEGDSDGQGSTPLPATLRHLSSQSSWPLGRAVRDPQEPLFTSPSLAFLPCSPPPPLPFLSCFSVY